jgi:hypothetical protein
MVTVRTDISVHTEPAMKFTTPIKPAEKARARAANPLRIITVMLAIFAVAAAAIVALG